MNNAELISKTVPVGKIGHVSTADYVSFVARISNPDNQENFATAEKLLKYLLKKSHWSPFQMIDMTFEIQTTRDIGRQILRHRSFEFQEFCVGKDTRITMAGNNGPRQVTIECLYKRWVGPYKERSHWIAKVYDEQKKCFVKREILEVFDTGIKSLYQITLEGDKHLQCTKDHKIYTQEGFKRLEDITLHDYIAVNGIPNHQTKDWLEKTKKLCIENKTGMFGMGDIAGVKPVTISKWLRKHGLQFTKNEVAQYCPIWNKGLPREKQPGYRKFRSVQTRLKQSRSAKKGEDSNLFKNGQYSIENLPWRLRVANWCKGAQNSLLEKQNYTCPESGNTIDYLSSEVDHILPVYSHPWLAFEETNLQVLSKEAHKKKTMRERFELTQTIGYKKIKDIKYIGENQTYDLQIDHKDHNYIANGIVTHNSQRYSEVQKDFVWRECRLQDPKNRQASLVSEDIETNEKWVAVMKEVIDTSGNAYKTALQMNVAKEQARALLPEGLTPTIMYMKGSLRSWFHYCLTRCNPGTQSEHREIAVMVWRAIQAEIPIFEKIDMNSLAIKYENAWESIL